MSKRGDNSDGTVVWKDGRSPSVLCTATNREGNPCQRPPLAGMTVCRAHGGAAPQVKRKAQQRLLEKVPKMLRMLQEIASDETVPPQVRLAAIRDWLDRAGIDRKIEVEVTSSTFEEFLAGVVAHVEEDALIANGSDYSDRFDVVAGELVEDRPAPSTDRAPLPVPASPTAPYRRPAV